jgi:hypothetical protein
MFGFKKTITPSEFGSAIVSYTVDFLAADAIRSFATRFEEAGPANNWPTFLEEQGVSRTAQTFYFRLFMHCTVQAAGTQFGERVRRGITEGAIATFKEKPSGEEFDRTYADLEAIYRGQHQFHSTLEVLENSEMQLSFLPNPNIAVLNARYLLERFVLPNVRDSTGFITDFVGYSGTLGSSLATVQRAINQLLGAHKIA